MTIVFSVKELDEFSIVSGVIPGDGVLDPGDLPSIDGPTVPAHKGVVLDGRMPVYCTSTTPQRGSQSMPPVMGARSWCSATSPTPLLLGPLCPSQRSRVPVERRAGGLSLPSR